MENTKIQWTDHTWNIGVGCKKVDSDCKFCYMYRGSLNGTRYDPKEIRQTKGVFKLPLKIKEPSKIFTSSLTDVFLEEVDAFRNQMWDIIRQCPHHTFQILTKRPERIIECLPPDWGEGWENVWIGTSIGSNDSVIRIAYLVTVPAKVRFLSLEPLHGPVTMHPYLNLTSEIRTHKPGSAIDWVIVGGESGNETGKYRYRPASIEWFENIIKQCQDNGVPVFVKQLGTFLAKSMGLKDRHGGDITEWPEYLQIRQFPK